MTHPRHITRRLLTALALTGVLALGLAGCGASGQDEGASSVFPDRGTAQPMDAAAPEAARDQGAVGTLVPGSTVTTSAPMMVRRADAALVVPSIRAAAAEIRALATTNGGSVLSESLSNPDTPDRGSEFGTITIQVPSDRLDDTLTRLEDVGEMVSRNTSSEDVKAVHVDLEARVKSMSAGVERMRTLMAQASDVGDIIAIESELGRRQADLEALQAQLASLEEQVAMSPISVRLTTDATTLGVDGGGFLGGLRAGWVAFIASVNYLLMALGALLPFAIAAAVVIVPLVLWLRRRARRPHPATPAPAPSSTPAPPSTPEPPPTP